MSSKDQTMPSGQKPIQGTPIDDILQQTEIGKIISDFKIPFMALVISSLIGVLGYGIYKSYINDAHDKYADKVFQFNESTLKGFEEKKIQKEEFVLGLDNLLQEVNEFKGATPLLFEASRLLTEKSHLSEAATYLEKTLKINSNTYVQYIAKAKLAALYEDLGKNDLAIQKLEQLSDSKLKILEDKVYLDLGRLYMKKGDNQKAIINFEQITKKLTKNNSGEEFTKLAKIYLSQLQAK